MGNHYSEDVTKLVSLLLTKPKHRAVPTIYDVIQLLNVRTSVELQQAYT